MKQPWYLTCSFLNHLESWLFIYSLILFLQFSSQISNFTTPSIINYNFSRKPGIVSFSDLCIVTFMHSSMQFLCIAVCNFYKRVTFSCYFLHFLYIFKSKQRTLWVIGVQRYSHIIIKLWTRKTTFRLKL